MVYQRYIVKGGKRIGPYFYDSVKGEGGKIKTVYLGKTLPKGFSEKPVEEKPRSPSPLYNEKIGKLKENIAVCESRKEKLKSRIVKIQERYKKGEINYSRYELLLNHYLQGKSLQHWLDYYDSYKVRVNEQIKKYESDPVTEKLAEPKKEDRIEEIVTRISTDISKKVLDDYVKEKRLDQKKSLTDIVTLEAPASKVIIIILLALILIPAFSFFKTTLMDESLQNQFMESGTEAEKELIEEMPLSEKKVSVSERIFSQAKKVPSTVTKTVASPFKHALKYISESKLSITGMITPSPTGFTIAEEENITLPDENITIPEENIAPEENVTLPEENITTPEENITLPEENITLPERNITLPEENITLPEENVTIPEEPLLENLTETLTGFEDKLKAKPYKPKVRLKNLLKEENKFVLEAESEDKKGKIVIRGLYNVSDIEDLQVTTLSSKKVSKGLITTPVVLANISALENATITLQKEGNVNAIVKCETWDFVKQRCESWTETSIPFVDDGESITFTVTEFSGYAGAELTIINVQSYPVVGEEWTVEFNTSGTADLVISAVEGTTWSNTEENEDLKFLEVRCGDEVRPYSWVDNKVIISNYSCAETGYEASKVLTAGKHALEFRFGEDVEYAYNQAVYNLYFSADATASPCPNVHRTLNLTSQGTNLQNTVVARESGEFDDATIPNNQGYCAWNATGTNIANTTACNNTLIQLVTESVRSSVSIGSGWLWADNLAGYTITQGDTINFTLSLIEAQLPGEHRYAARVSVVTCSNNNMSVVTDLLTQKILGNTSVASGGQDGWRDSDSRMFGPAVNRITPAGNQKENATFTLPVGKTYTFSSGEMMLVELGFGDASNTTDHTLVLRYNFTETNMSLVLTEPAGNTAPINPMPVLNFTYDNTNYTNESMWCQFNVTDPNSEAQMYVNLSIINNTADNSYVEQWALTNLPYADETQVNFEINETNFTKGDYVVCQMQVCDDESLCSNFVNSTSLKVENYPIQISSPLNNFTINEDFTQFTLDWTNNYTDPDDAEGKEAFINWTYEMNDTNILSVSVDNDTDVVTISPIANAFGSVEINWTVLDDDNAQYNETVVWIVSGVNDVPVVVNATYQSGLGANGALSEAVPTPIIVSFLAMDFDGAANIDNTSAYLNVTNDGADMRQNISASPYNCYPETVGSNATAQNYTCTIEMQHWDLGGSWTCTAEIRDGSAYTSTAVPNCFTVGTTTAINISSTTLSWSQLFVGDIDKMMSTSELNVTNTGNVNLTNITLQGINLVGEITNTVWIPSGNFTAAWGERSCNIGGWLINDTNVQLPGSRLDFGPGSMAVTNNATHVCLEEVGQDITQQSYSTAGDIEDWTITGGTGPVT